MFDYAVMCNYSLFYILTYMMYLAGIMTPVGKVKAKTRNFFSKRCYKSTNVVRGLIRVKWYLERCYGLMTSSAH